MVEAIQTVMSGVRDVSLRVSETIGAPASAPNDQPDARLLSDRELEVMRLLARGQTVEQIASLLPVSARAVCACRGRVIRRLTMRGDARPARELVV
jgi:DNA-binding NarL/FixJ family response regulator